MALFEFPNPVAFVEAAKNGSLERSIANSLISALYSSWICGMWREGSSKWAVLTGAGQGMKDAATAMYLSLRELEDKNFLVLTVPQDLLEANNLSKFQTELKEKK